MAAVTVDRSVVGVPHGGFLFIVAELSGTVASNTLDIDDLDGGQGHVSVVGVLEFSATALLTSNLATWVAGTGVITFHASSTTTKVVIISR